MSPSDWSLRGNQIFGILIPGVMWGFSGLMLLHLPRPPVELITVLEPSWVEAAAFVGASYIVGFAVRPVSWWFAESAAGLAAGILPSLFEDADMEERADDLQIQVLQVIGRRYSDSKGFEAPPADRVFGFCKRILRGEAPELYKHLDISEEEINLLNLLPLPLLIFAPVWIGTWIASGGALNWYVVPLGLVAVLAALFCLARFHPLRWAERKETFESFLAFDLESTRTSTT